MGMAPYVLHIDLDQFIVAVELLRRPELRGKPVVVGGRGDPMGRGVVAGASYEARSFGVRSGMPTRTALRRCPDAVFLHPDRSEYERASQRVMAALAGLGFPFENAGWDEAFIEVANDDPEEVANRVRAVVMSAADLSCAVGIGNNKLQAKMATEFAKPGGVSRLGDDEWREVMYERSTDALWGIGKKTAAKLAELNIMTVADLASAPEEMLVGAFGPSTGRWLKAMGLGRGGSVDTTPRVRRSLSREVTFQQDLREITEIRARLQEIAEVIASDLRNASRLATHVTLKIRFAPFFTHSHSVRLESPTNDAGTIRAAAAQVLSDVEVTRPVRLLGLRATLSAPQPPP
jgi:DNA polymerase IV